MTLSALIHRQAILEHKSCAFEVLESDFIQLFEQNYPKSWGGSPFLSRKNRRCIKIYFHLFFLKV